MTFFAPSEHIELIAAQNFRYDSYVGHQYYLERVEVNGKYGLACVEEVEEGGVHSHILLPPVYCDIQVRKISSTKANYDRYLVFADGQRIGAFTMVLNSWVIHSNN